MEYLNDEEVAKLLGISLGRLRNKLVASDPLPPRICPPGCRVRLWSKDAVHKWLQQFQRKSNRQDPSVTSNGWGGRL